MQPERRVSQSSDAQAVAGAHQEGARDGRPITNGRGGDVVVVTHRVRPGHEEQFAEVMDTVMRPLVLALLKNAGGGSWQLFRGRGDTNDFLEVLSFPNESVREAFDLAYSHDRKVAGVTVFLEGTVVDEAANYRLYEPVEQPSTSDASVSPTGLELHGDATDVEST